MSINEDDSDYTIEVNNESPQFVTQEIKWSKEDSSSSDVNIKNDEKNSSGISKSQSYIDINESSRNLQIINEEISNYENNNDKNFMNSGSNVFNSFQEDTKNKFNKKSGQIIYNQQNNKLQRPLDILLEKPKIFEERIVNIQNIQKFQKEKKKDSFDGLKKIVYSCNTVFCESIDFLKKQQKDCLESINALENLYVNDLNTIQGETEKILNEVLSKKKKLEIFVRKLNSHQKMESMASTNYSNSLLGSSTIRESYNPLKHKKYNSSDLKHISSNYNFLNIEEAPPIKDSRLIYEKYNKNYLNMNQETSNMDIKDFNISNEEKKLINSQEILNDEYNNYLEHLDCNMQKPFFVHKNFENKNLEHFYKKVKGELMRFKKNFFEVSHTNDSFRKQNNKNSSFSHIISQLGSLYSTLKKRLDLSENIEMPRSNQNSIFMKLHSNSNVGSTLNFESNLHNKSKLILERKSVVNLASNIISGKESPIKSSKITASYQQKSKPSLENDNYHKNANTKRESGFFMVNKFNNPKFKKSELLSNRSSSPQNIIKVMNNNQATANMELNDKNKPSHRTHETLFSYQKFKDQNRTLSQRPDKTSAYDFQHDENYLKRADFKDKNDDKR